MSYAERSSIIPNEELEGLMGKTRNSVGKDHSSKGTRPSEDWDMSPPRGTVNGGYKRCHHSHPPLKITTPEGQEFEVYGGSCHDPVIRDMDVFIGLDFGMKFFEEPRKQYPWHPEPPKSQKRHTPEVQFLFRITDGSVPQDLNEFLRMLIYVKGELEAGKKVFIGCIGGHGRTGLVLAALVQLIAKNPDAINYVRENYCHKAVESSEQVAWLNKHFGITPAQPSKSYGGLVSSHAPERAKSQGTKATNRASALDPLSGTPWGTLAAIALAPESTKKAVLIRPVKCKEGHIHGDNILTDPKA